MDHQLPLRRNDRLRAEYIQISALAPMPGAPRHHPKAQTRALKKSLETFGQVLPILIDGESRIISGLALWTVAKQLGLGEVMVIRVEYLTEPQVKALMVALNRLGDLSRWDDRALSEILVHLHELDLDFDIEATGFTEIEIELRVQDLDFGEPDEAAVIVGEGPTIVRPGELWKLGDHLLYCGDALLETSWRTLMGTELAAAVVTDPPFNVAIDGHVTGSGKHRHREFAMASGELSQSEFIEFLTKAMGHAHRCSAPGSIHYWAMDWRHVVEIGSAGQAVYDRFLNMAVWTKNRPGMGSFLRSQHELFFIFAKGGAPARNNVQLGRFGRSRSNVWSYPSAASLAKTSEEGNPLSFHPTVKPLALVADILLDSTIKGDIVADPFAGSGTTLIACEKLGRRARTPGSERNVEYAYDLLGRQLSATFRYKGIVGPIQSVTNTYDALGRMTSSTSNMDGANRTVSSRYDPAGNRTRVAVNVSGYGADRSYDNLSRMTAVAGLGIGYDNLGRRSALNYTFSGATNSTAAYGYDAIDRLSSLTHDLAGTANDQTFNFSYNPASQIGSRTATNDSYAYTGSVNVNRSYTSNGLNQYTAAGSASFTYDANGNMTSDGSNTFVYDSENRLTSVSGARTASLAYDPLGRLWSISAPSGTTNFIYDGDHDIVETDGSGNWKQEFVWGPGADEPLLQWDGAGPKMLHADERGSVISTADTNGNLTQTNSYDEYGTPGSGNQGRFQYTGQAWLNEIGLYYYKARMYSPTAGRFLQTDPIGQAASANIYGYVNNDPVNLSDPLGLSPLSLANAKAAKALFGNSLNTSAVDIRFSSPIAAFAPAVTIGNTIYVHGATASGSLLAHELTHVWQLQLGGFDQEDLIDVQITRFLLRYDPYAYTITPDSSFQLYNPEAQAAIVENCVRSRNTRSGECQLFNSLRDRVGLERQQLSEGFFFFPQSAEGDAGYVDRHDIVIPGPYYPPVNPPDAPPSSP